MKTTTGTVSIGGTFSGLLLTIALIALVFSGEPSIAESLRVAVQKWAAGL